jgi:UDP-N-acetylmuramyl pentapeptide phosphotransferase/UDP-N-acetylglucosamine-1-phosphate transferase
MTGLEQLLLISSVPASAGLTWAVRGVARHRSLLDRPNDRSAHVTPTPRLGGIGIVIPFLVISYFLLHTGPGRWTHGGVVLGGAAAMAALGLLDDLRPIPAYLRFAGQAAIAVTMVYLAWDAVEASTKLLGFLPPAIRAPLVVLWILWMTNLYNFMDGIDGLAAGQAVLASLGIAAGALATGLPTLAGLGLALAGAALGFLLFNYSPASIFMGDVGSTTLGFLLACFPFLSVAPALPLEAIAIATAFFILDATATLARRVLSGERWYEAHRGHYYQRPLACGVSHRSICHVAYTAFGAASLSSFAYLAGPRSLRLPLALLPVAIFLGLIVWVRRLERADRSS